MADGNQITEAFEFRVDNSALLRHKLDIVIYAKEGDKGEILRLLSWGDCTARTEGQSMFGDYHSSGVSRCLE